MSRSDIVRVLAWEALDSRGRPTVAAEIGVRNGALGRATAPAGTSRGKYEAKELRDGGVRYEGMGVRRAVNFAKEALAESLRGIDAANQYEVDQALRSTDGTSNLGRVGANAVIALSTAASIAAAASWRTPLWRWNADEEGTVLPLPIVNVISGGRHVEFSVDIQDILVVPVGASTFSQATEWCSAVRSAVARLARSRGLVKKYVMDEGRLGPGISSNIGAIRLVMEGADACGLRPGRDVCIGLDVAATHLYRNGTYEFAQQAERYSSEELVAEVARWCHDYPIVMIEDPVQEDDWAAWVDATQRLEPRLIVGDDLFATNLDRLREGVERGAANSILIKPNQNGTVSGTSDVVKYAQQVGYGVMVSDRSGDSDDHWLSDLAVRWKAQQIKLGSTMRSERTAKWNRLLQIEAHLGSESRMFEWNYEF